jgi:predicted dehydrogenase
MIRVGLIGVGPWGRRYIQTIAKRSDCRVTAYCRQSNNDDVPIEGAARVASWQELLTLGKHGVIDAIIAAADPTLHPDIAIAGLRGSIPVLIEKPLGLSSGAIASVRSTFEALERPAPILVDMIHLFSPAYVALKKRLVALNNRGRILRIETRGTNRGPFRRWSTLYDYGPHDMAFCFDLLGLDAPLTVRKASKQASELGGCTYRGELDVDGTCVEFEFGNGAQTKKRYLAVECSAHTLAYDDTLCLHEKVTDNCVAIRIDSTSPLDCVLEAFYSQICLWRSDKDVVVHRSDENAFLTNASNAIKLAERIHQTLEAIHVAATT